MSPHPCHTQCVSFPGDCAIGSDRVLRFVSIKDLFQPGTSAYGCNPSYWGGWDQEDCGLRPTQANCSRPDLKKNQSKMDGR
jgi:hypothetical protein